MEDLIILVLVAIVFFLLWNGRQTVRYEATTEQSAIPSEAPVSPDVTQVILEKVQQSSPAIYPLETLYIKNMGKGLYDARFMFFNTDGYYGTQYDVKANVGDDGSVQIVSKTETAITGDAQNPGYVPDTYQSYESIEENLNRQLQDAIKKPVIANGYLESSAGRGKLDFYDTRVDTFALASKEMKQIAFKVYLPDEPAVKIVQGMFNFTTADGDELNVRQVLEFN